MSDKMRRRRRPTRTGRRDKEYFIIVFGTGLGTRHCANLLAKDGRMMQLGQRGVEEAGFGLWDVVMILLRLSLGSGFH